MNGAAGEKQEAEKRIKKYIQVSAMGLNKKEEQDFNELVLHNEETAKKVFRGSNHTGKAYILIFLNSQGKGADIAKEEAAAGAGQMEFINSNPLEERAFRSWLSGETDIMPETMPVNKYIMGFPHRKNVELCYLSKVCTFTERLIVYGIKRGYVDIVRGSVKEMMREIGVPYAHSFLEHQFGRTNYQKKISCRCIPQSMRCPETQKRKRGFTGILFVYGWSRIRTGI